jgi:hypothetical protein
MTIITRKKRSVKDAIIMMRGEMKAEDERTKSNNH